MSAQRRLAQFVQSQKRLIEVLHYAYRFLQPKYSVGVVGVVMNEQHEVLLVEHLFHPHHPWGLPGGWIGLNENPAQTVIRELSEELQLTVHVQSLLLAKRTSWNHLDFAYLCKTDEAIGAMSYELMAYDWFVQRDLPPLSPFHSEAIQAAYEQRQGKSS